MRGPREHGLPWLPILVASLVNALFAGLMARHYVKPVRILRNSFEAVARGCLGTRVGSALGEGRDGLSRLGQDFDRMAAQLQSLFESRRRLLHDVSHELKSPLARLQAASELLNRVPERQKQLLAHIERDTARIDQLVSELLTLARLDDGLSVSLTDVVGLSELLHALMEANSMEAELKGCQLVLHDLLQPGQVAARVQGNHEMLYRAFGNVLRNAIRYSPAQGQIVLVAALRDQRLCVSVEDSGPGVNAGDLEHIFEPFFRAASERKPDGHGLGLAVTRSVCEAHGGRAYAQNRPEGGLAVHIELPVMDGA